MVAYEVFDRELTTIAGAGGRSSLFFSAGTTMISLGLSLPFGVLSFAWSKSVEVGIAASIVLAVALFAGGAMLIFFGIRSRSEAAAVIQEIRESTTPPEEQPPA